MTDKTPKTQVIGVRLPPEDVERINAAIKRKGYDNRSDGLRALLLSAVAFADTMEGVA